MQENPVKPEKTRGGTVWQKCSRHDLSKHPSISVGSICPYCLHERLSSLCPNCAHDLPCSCTPRASVDNDVPFADIGSIGRIANLIECESPFRKSTSKPCILSSKPEPVIETRSNLESTRRHWIWRMLRGNKGETKDVDDTLMEKAKSDGGDVLFSPATVTSKGHGWYFPSPIKVFRESRVSKMIFQQRSPLYRG